MPDSLANTTVDELFAAAQRVWNSVLELPLRMGASVKDEMPGMQHYTVWIEMAEKQHYALYAVCDQPMVDHAASRMFDKLIAQLTDADRQDALGELLNIVAGELGHLTEQSVDQGVPVYSEKATHPPYCQRLVCAIEANSEGDHVYFALCSYSDAAEPYP